MPAKKMITVAPSAARLTESLRDIGYDFSSALSDLIDNSIAAGAERIEVLIQFDGQDSSVLIADDGCGMSANELVEGLRFGTRRSYDKGELGRYGLGLKTASLSQCRRIVVVSRKAVGAERINSRCLDLDLNIQFDDWLVVDPGRDPVVQQARDCVVDGAGTVVVWQNLDRVLPEKNVDGGWARRRFDGLRRKAIEHLGMVFHRFIEGTPDGRRITILVNGEKVRAWNPYAVDEAQTEELSAQTYEIGTDDHYGEVRLQRYVLPARDRFSSPGEFDRLAGPLKWNRQQGLYIYRAGRLVQWGGWGGMRAIDEHTKLARASLDFDTDLDTLFNINVAKMRVALPAQLRVMLERPVHELAMRADETYRKASRKRGARPSDHVGSEPRLGSTAGLALRAAALQAGEFEAFKRTVAVLKRDSPDVAGTLGL